jgi:ubiquitin-like 1-activating enzyme E1 B
VSCQPIHNNHPLHFTDWPCSLDRLSKRLKALQSEESGSPAVLVFDKDDVDTLDFVTASANLRANIFGIEAKSKFDTKRTFILVS